MQERETLRYIKKYIILKIRSINTVQEGEVKEIICEKGRDACRHTTSPVFLIVQNSDLLGLTPLLATATLISLGGLIQNSQPLFIDSTSWTLSSSGHAQKEINAPVARIWSTIAAFQIFNTSPVTIFTKPLNTQFWRPPLCYCWAVVCVDFPSQLQASPCGFYLARWSFLDSPTTTDGAICVKREKRLL